MIGDLNQILSAGSFAHQHTVGIICFQDRIQFIDFLVDFIGSYGVFVHDQHQLIFVAFQDLFEVIRNHALGKTGADHAFQSQNVLDTVYAFHFVDHVVFLFFIQIFIQKNHMGRTHIVFLLQFGIGLNTGQILWQAGIQVVVDVCVGLKPGKGDKQYYKQDGKQRMVFDNKF